MKTELKTAVRATKTVCMKTTHGDYEDRTKNSGAGNKNCVYENNSWRLVRHETVKYKNTQNHMKKRDMKYR